MRGPDETNLISWWLEKNRFYKFKCQSTSDDAPSTWPAAQTKSLGNSRIPWSGGQQVIFCLQVFLFFCWGSARLLLKSGAQESLVLLRSGLAVVQPCVCVISQQAGALILLVETALAGGSESSTRPTKWRLICERKNRLNKKAVGKPACFSGCRTEQLLLPAL